MITLSLKEEPPVPLEAEALSPDVVATLRYDEICALPMFLGKRQCRVDDHFVVEGEASDELEIRGDAGRVKWIGRGMTRGRLRIVGNAGMHLGAYMKGGTIEVTGSAGDWAGAEMSGGLIRIGGNAGGQIGAAYRGSRTGMTDGTILIEGSAGLEVGMRMKRGTIAIKGSVKDFAGLEMKGGTLIVGGAELRTGAWMTRGTIVSLTRIPLLPTFAYSGTCNPTFLRLYARQLGTCGFSVPCDASAGAYLLYTGDTAVSDKGEILAWQPHAS
ncbi:MAG: formylmethanofuran dehydrogenase subunit C [Planctomycetes bacterium]|nr:formylmethanofuran dehydrogenase subunit C [Planctomycetota bacterium]